MLHHILYPCSVAYMSLLRSARPMTQSPRRVVQGSGWLAVTTITELPASSGWKLLPAPAPPAPPAGARLYRPPAPRGGSATPPRRPLRSWYMTAGT